MDARLTAEQRDLRDAAARLAAELGPGSVAGLADADRAARLEKAVAATGWRTLRSDGASGVDVAIVAEEFGRGLIDVPFLGPVLADDLRRHARSGPGTASPVTASPVTASPVTAGPDAAAGAWTIAVDGEAVDARGMQQAVALRGRQLLVAQVGPAIPGADLTRTSAGLLGGLAATGPPSAGPPSAGELPAGELAPEQATRWHALALVVTCADLLGAARGAHALACDYARMREQYGRTIGSYQAVAHPLAEGRALIEGCVSVLRHAAWAVDALDPDQAVRAAAIAKVYAARAAATIAEAAIQVHGGIGNTWECLAHVFLRRVLTATELFPARLEEIDLGLS
jgi:hypothetical protein